MSGLWARDMLAGRDGVRYPRSKHMGGDYGALAVTAPKARGDLGRLEFEPLDSLRNWADHNAGEAG